MQDTLSSSSWQTFFNLGGIAGALSLLWQTVREGRSYYRRPRLRCLEFTQSRDIFSFENAPGDLRRFVTLQIENFGRRSARACVARATATPTNGQPPRSVALHWADTPVTYSTTAESLVDIPPHGTRRLDLAYSTSARTGCWLASLSALYGNYFADAELMEGEHRVEISLTFEDGKDYRCALRLFSPKDWRELNAAAL